MSLSACVAEIQAKLEPVLKELGLRVDYSSSQDRYFYVEFTRAAARNWMSPVEVRFQIDRFEDFAEESARWDNAHFCVNGSEKRHILGTEWYWQERSFAEFPVKVASKEDLFEKLAMALRAEELWTDDPRHASIPNRPNSKMLERRWGDVEEEFEQYGIAGYDFERSEDGVETLSFSYDGREIELSFPPNEGPISMYLDGELCSTLKDHAAEERDRTFVWMVTHELKTIHIDMVERIDEQPEAGDGGSKRRP